MVKRVNGENIRKMIERKKQSYRFIDNSCKDKILFNGIKARGTPLAVSLFYRYKSWG